MSINQRQYEQLTEVGICLWQHKAVAFVHNSSNEYSATQTKSTSKLPPEYLTTLAKQTIFTDMLQILALSIGEITLKSDHLDFGLFNWYFNSSEQIAPAIHCIDNNLVSPSIELISQSPALKKQLWQIIINNLL